MSAVEQASPVARVYPLDAPAPKFDAQALRQMMVLKTHQGDPGDCLTKWLGRITGVCLGSSMHTGRRVQEWIDAGRTDAPSLPDQPNPHIHYLQKLFVQAIFQAINSNKKWQAIDWRHINYDDHPDLNAEIHRRYQALTAKAIGAKFVERLPAQGLTPMDELEPLFETLKHCEWDDHYLIIFSQNKGDIYESHVVYFHPKAGIFFDPDNLNGFSSWQASEETQPQFLQIVAAYLHEHYADRGNFLLYRVHYEEAPKTSLFRQRVSSGFSTLYQMGKYDKTLGAQYALELAAPVCIAKYNPLNREYYALLAEQASKVSQERLQAALKKSFQEGDLDAFVEQVKNHDGAFPRTYPSVTTDQDLENVHLLLEKMDKLGAKFEPIRAALWNSAFYYLYSKATCKGDPTEQDRLYLKSFADLLRFRETRPNKQEYDISCREGILLDTACSGFSHYYKKSRLFLLECFKCKEFGLIYADDNLPSLRYIERWCINDNADLLKEAVEHGAGPMIQELGSFFLAEAALWGNEKMVKYLCGLGCKLDLTDQRFMLYLKRNHIRLDMTISAYVDFFITSRLTEFVGDAWRP